MTLINAKTTTLIAIRTHVTGVAPGRFQPSVPRSERRGCRVVRRPSAMQSGHWKPTDASRMQSGQIGRPQRWQRM
jgi:hypothetical protein